MSAYPYLDSQNIAIKQDVSFPALGGLDLTTDKLSVNPGTLQECLNYEVGTEPGYKQIDGLMRYSGRSYNVVQRPVCGNLADITYDLQQDDGEFAVASNNSISSNIRTYKIVNQELTDAQTFTAGFSSQVIALAVSPDGKYVAYTGTSSPYLEIRPTNGGDLGSALSLSDTPDTIINECVWSADGQYLAVAHNTTGTGSYADNNLSVFSFEDDDLTLVDSIRGLSGGGFRVAWSPDGSRLLFTADVNFNVAVISFDGSSLSVENTSNLGTSSNTINYKREVIFLTNDRGCVGRQSVFDHVDIPDLTTIQGGLDGASFSLSANHLFVPSRHGFAGNGNKAYALGAALTEVASTSDDMRYLGSSPSGGLIFTNVSNDSLRLYSFDGSAFTILDTVVYATTVSAAKIWPYWTDKSGLFLGGNYKTSLDDDDNNDFIGEIKPIKLTDDSICYQIIDGDDSVLSESGQDIRVYPDREDTDTYATISNQDIVTYSSVDDYITKYFDHNKGLAADSFRPPGSGPITSLFELDDMVYATRDNEAGDAGKLYKTTDLPDLAKDVEWEEIDLGLTLDFKNGRTNPLTIYDKEFLDVEVEPSNPVLDKLGSEAESVATLDLVGSNLNVTTSTGAWANPEHALSDDNDDVMSTAFRQHASINVWYQTQLLRITDFDVGKDASVFARVVGVKAEVAHGYKGTISGSGTMEFRMKSAHLTNVGGTDNKRDATVRSQTTADGDQFYTSILGSDTDDWNAGDPSIENFFDEDFGIDLVFEGRYISGDITTSSQGNRFYVRWVKLSVYFDDGSERVYFWNGTSDVAEADVLDTQVESGSWENDDAKGTFTLYNAVTPENIIPDLEIRSAPDGAGAYIADTDGVTTSGVFPTSTQINDENAFVQTIKSNFYMDEEKEAIYGVSGAGPAFTFDGTYMRQVRSPVPKEKDKPRHIANHQDHLVLGFKSGSILVSVAGEPTLFDGVEGASEWGFGSRITGLLPLKGNALAVFTRDSTHAFIGNSLENFTTQYISKTSGALEYSMVNMGQPIYCDNFGISNIGVTEQYGDFNWNKLSRSISPWIQDAIQESSDFIYNYPEIVTALPVRYKNQYRLYFSDGTNLTMAMAPVPEGDFPMFTFHNYSEGNDFSENHFVPTASLSTVLSDGRELTMVGDKQGDIYVLEQGTGILTNSELIPYDSYITFNPFNGDMPVQNIKYNQTFIHLKHAGKQELTLSAGVNYLQPVPTTFTDTVEGVTPLGGIHFDLVPDKIVAHLPSVTDGFSLKINSTSNGNLPHIVQAITYKVAPSSSKNAAPNRY